ncbi:MazG family protein [Glaciecola sp. XM2]|uniref:MazG nucleotide pyrophosphohydrolase domain-containing protein n=1 Tax=Glaciecola sp. XM2 TaxID=1914931 RepID=UPI001BDF2B6E|nr:MazG nucleotide pyrophosphohydrolase domain-containing protein [Glaciecola sp. XM2]MBT1451072.1 MazG family protein [Glaciecola sp. XM2]
MGVGNTPDNKANIALSKALRVQLDARELGFDWTSALPVFDKVHEELLEVKQALLTGDLQGQEEELGDLLFAAVNLARHLQVSPEHALLIATHKFECRFSLVKQMAREQNLELNGLTEQELDHLWNKAKVDVGKV